MVTVLGSGLLVGTALAVIIPEGVHALYQEGKQRKEQENNSMVDKCTMILLRI